MSQTRHFPVYVVRLPNNEGCGHQHSSRKKAWGCAETIAMKRKNLAWIEVRRIRSTARGLTEQTVGRVTKYHVCDQCKGLVLVMDDGEERGHYEDCSLVVV